MATQSLGATAPNVLPHPAFGCAPVANPRLRGRKKGVASLAVARRKQLMQQAAAKAADPQAFILPPVVPGHFHFPRALLRQPHFCRLGDGRWQNPPLNFAMLGAPQFVSPLGALLDQLEAEGHDVGGARVEWLAFREAAAQLDQRINELGKNLYGLTWWRPTQAAALYEQGRI